MGPARASSYYASLCIWWTSSLIIWRSNRFFQSLLRESIRSLKVFIARFRLNAALFSFENCSRERTITSCYDVLGSARSSTLKLLTANWCSFCREDNFIVHFIRLTCNAGFYWFFISVLYITSCCDIFGELTPLYFKAAHRQLVQFLLGRQLYCTLYPAYLQCRFILILLSVL